MIESNTPESTETAPDDLTARMRSIEDRLTRLEETVHRLPQTPVDMHRETDYVNLTEAASVKEEVEEEEKPPVETTEQPPPAPTEIGLEAKIGSYWLNRIGLLAVLIGVVSLLLYSFQYFGAALKIGFGFLLSAGIIYLSRSPRVTGRTKSRQDAGAPRTVEWFGHGLNALGWSIAYFCGYAMYFIPGLKLFDSAVIEVAILAGLSTCMMFDAIRSKSEFTALLSTVFAATSICLSSATIDPFVALLIILAAAAYVSIWQHWYRLLLGATISFYGAFAYAFQSTSSATDISSLAILIGSWIVIYGTIYFAQEGANNKLVATSLINGLIGSLYMSMVLERMHLEQNLAQTAPFAALGLIYLATANLFRKSGAQLWNMHLLMGLSLGNVAIFGRFSGNTPVLSSIAQVGLLGSIGVIHRIPAFRWFAAVLAIVTVNFSSDWPIGMVAAAVYAGLAHLNRKYSRSEVQESRELLLLSNFYLTAANILAAVVIGSLHQAFGWKGFLWTLQLLANAVYALITHSDYVRIIALVMLLLNAPLWLFSASSENSVPVALTIASIYAFAGFCRKLTLQSSEQLRDAKIFMKLSGAFATILLTVFILNTVPNSWLSIACCLEGMALIAAGFWLKEKLIRVAGLIVFAIMLVHLLFFDFASAPTITRIISFIVSGLILVACSYGYAWFSKKFDEK